MHEFSTGREFVGCHVNLGSVKSTVKITDTHAEKFVSVRTWFKFCVLEKMS